jgi:two-component system response regulator YesN
MEQAAKLLKSKSPERICDIAEKVGYTSVKHFSYVFKQYFNTTPGEYQNKNISTDSIE